MEILTMEQGSPEWYEARLGKVTSSMIGAVMAKGRGSSPSKTRQTYMYKLIGERLTGDPMDSYTNDHMERGKEQEDEAIALYSMMNDVAVEPVGFVQRQATAYEEMIGASPDGFVSSNGGVQIKSALAHIQIPRILDAKANRAPPEHMAQLQGELWITKRDWIDFASYCPRLPLAQVRVYRDEAFIARIRVAVETFLGELLTVISQLSGDP